MSIKRPGPLKSPARSSFFIVGAPRCGTSSLSKALAQNPKICFSVPKETHFFLNDIDETSVDLERDYIKKYFTHLEPGHTAIGEGSVSYLYSAEAIRRVLAFDPDAKFIAMVRNPIDLVHSYHARMLFTMDEDEREFARAWALQERRARGEGLPRKCRDPRLLMYGEVGRLGAHLERLLDLAPEGSCQVIVFDDLAADPVAVYRRTLSFLRIEDDGRTSFPKTRRNKGVRSGFLQRFIMNPPRWGAKALGFHDLAPTSGPRFVRSIRRRLKQKNTFNDPRSPLDPETRATLRDYFSSDIAKLGAILERDLSHWR